MDPEACECPICLSVFQGSIFQCKNGHVVCESCLVRIHGTCPSCREPVGDIRCRALENVIAGRALPGSFRSHECPLQGCAYSGLLLYDHIKDAHTCFDYEVSDFGSAWQVWLDRSKPFLVLLDAVERRVFLLLNGGDVPSGRSLSLVCLAPRPTATDKLMAYKLEVCGASALSLSATGSVPFLRRWTGQYPTDGFLFVPDAYYCASLDHVGVKVHVDPDHAHAHALDRLASSVRRFDEADPDHAHAHALDRLASSVRRFDEAMKPLDLFFLVVLAFLFAAMVADPEIRRRALNKWV